MLGCGYFNPLSGFMNKQDALSIADDMETTSGLFWQKNTGPISGLGLEIQVAEIRLLKFNPVESF
jgi:PUA-like domain